MECLLITRLVALLSVVQYFKETLIHRLSLELYEA
jgi:hypothetical protein